MLASIVICLKSIYYQILIQQFFHQPSIYYYMLFYRRKFCGVLQYPLSYINKNRHTVTTGGG